MGNQCFSAGVRRPCVLCRRRPEERSAAATRPTDARRSDTATSERSKRDGDGSAAADGAGSGDAQKKDAANSASDAGGTPGTTLGESPPQRCSPEGGQTRTAAAAPPPRLAIGEACSQRGGVVGARAGAQPAAASLSARGERRRDAARAVQRSWSDAGDLADSGDEKECLRGRQSEDAAAWTTATTTALGAVHEVLFGRAFSENGPSHSCTPDMETLWRAFAAPPRRSLPHVQNAAFYAAAELSTVTAPGLAGAEALGGEASAAAIPTYFSKVTASAAGGPLAEGISAKAAYCSQTEPPASHGPSRVATAPVVDALTVRKPQADGFSSPGRKERGADEEILMAQGLALEKRPALSQGRPLETEAGERQQFSALSAPQSAASSVAASVSSIAVTSSPGDEAQVGMAGSCDYGTFELPVPHVGLVRHDLPQSHEDRGNHPEPNTLVLGTGRADRRESKKTGVRGTSGRPRRKSRSRRTARREKRLGSNVRVVSGSGFNGYISPSPLVERSSVEQPAKSFAEASLETFDSVRSPLSVLQNFASRDTLQEDACAQAVLPLEGSEDDQDGEELMTYSSSSRIVPPTALNMGALADLETQSVEWNSATDGENPGDSPLSHRSAFRLFDEMPTNCHGNARPANFCTVPLCT